MSSGPLVLAIDLGMTSTKCALFDKTGARIHATTIQISYPLITDRSGRAEIGTRELAVAFDQCIVQSIEAARAFHGSKSFQIAAVGISCFWHSLIGLDSKGNPLTEVITSADSRCLEDAARLRKRWKEKKIHHSTGCMVRTSYWPAKLAWLKRTDKELWKRAARWVSAGEWLFERWCGTGICSPGMASGTGLFRSEELQWDTSLLKSLGVSKSKLNPVGETICGIQPGRAIGFRELKNSKWIPALGEGAASNLGSGVMSLDKMMLQIEASATLQIMGKGIIPKIPSPFGLFCYRVDPERYLQGGAISNAGNLRSWCFEQLRLPENPLDLELEMAKRQVPNHGLLVSPLWIGENASSMQERLPGMIIGLNPTTTALDIFQATTEAVYCRIARIAQKLQKIAPDSPQLIVSGSIRNSPSSLQRLADILGKALYPSSETESALRGAAVFALERIGYNVSPIPLGLPIQPDEQRTLRYRELMTAQMRFEQRFLKETKQNKSI